MLGYICAVEYVGTEYDIFKNQCPNKFDLKNTVIFWILIENIRRDHDLMYDKKK